MGCQGARRDVEDSRRQFAGDLEHIGNLEQKPLGGGERAGEGPCLERAVDSARRAAFALHLNHGGDSAPKILNPFGGPLVAPFAHVRGGSDGIDAHNLVAAIGHVGDRFVTVNCRIDFVHNLLHSRWTFALRELPSP